MGIVFSCWDFVRWLPAKDESPPEGGKKHIWQNK